MNPTLKKLEETYKDKIRIVFRDLPLLNIHKNAGVAAEAAHCANDQGKFWEMHDRLFANQAKLSAPELKEHAVAVGLTADTFNQCLDSGQVHGGVEEGLRGGQPPRPQRHARLLHQRPAAQRSAAASRPSRR